MRVEVGVGGNSPGNSVPVLLRCALRAQELRCAHGARGKTRPRPFELFQSPGAEIGVALQESLCLSGLLCLDLSCPALRTLENELPCLLNSLPPPSRGGAFWRLQAGGGEGRLFC